MRDLLGWSVSLGRWFGVRVRLHVFFLLFAVVAAMQKFEGDLGWYWLSTVFILLTSVLLHEAGHCYAARKVGGAADLIVLWPLGGLAPARVPHDPQAELITALAGPVVNVLICLALAPVLILANVELLQLNRRGHLGWSRSGWKFAWR